MPQKVPFQIVLPYNKTKQIGINPERTINMYAVNIGDSEAPSALIKTAGLTRTVTFQQGSVVRNEFVYNGNLYVVVDQFVYTLDKLLTPLLLGSLGTTSGEVSIAANNMHQIVFVDGTGGWVYNDSTNVFERITDSGFPNPAPSTVTFFNSFFVVNSIGTNLWAISDTNDGLSWDPTNHQNFQSQPDTIVAISLINTSLFIFGTRNIEVWVGIPQFAFPFSQDTTIRFQYGAASLGSVTEGEGMLFWLAQSNNGRASVMMSNGSFPQVVSTTDIDQEINSYPTISDAVGYLYRLNGHLFYALYFPTAGVSWLYDATTQYWVQQQMQDGSMYVVSDAAAFNNIIYAGSRSGPYLYVMDQDVLTNDGESINRIRITQPFVSPTLQAIRLNSLEIDIVQGVGSLNPPGVNPFIELQVSYDRGITWAKQRKSYISKLGYTVGYRCVFRNLGINKDFCFRIAIYDPVDVTIRSAAINFDIVGN